MRLPRLLDKVWHAILRRRVQSGQAPPFDRKNPSGAGLRARQPKAARDGRSTETAIFPVALCPEGNDRWYAYKTA